MFAVLTAWLAACGGCVGIGGQHADSSRRKPPEAEPSGQVVPAAFDEEVEEEPPLLTVTRKTFPQQGWWCGEYDEWLSSERADRGYTIVLPGIEGTSWFNISVARGLADADYAGAVEINDWTTGYWPMFVYHLMALERNKAQALAVAEKIIAYQDRYPGRPVTLIGHSGGAALAVLVLEALPPDRKIDQAILLAGALSPDYDLSKALNRTERGITNFYSGGDVVYLVAGTWALGTIDRQHAVSAGAVGFRTPDHLAADRRAWYESMVHDEPYRREMVWSLNFGGHFGPVNRKFVAQWVAPRIRTRGASSHG